MTTPATPQRLPSYQHKLRGGWQSTPVPSTATPSSRLSLGGAAPPRLRREAMPGQRPSLRVVHGPDHISDPEAFWNRFQRRLAQDSTDRLSAVAADIRASSELSSASVAANAIESTWERIESICSLAESRLRLLLPKLGSPQRAPRAAWLEQALKELRTSPDAEQPAEDAVRSADNLVRALFSRLADNELPELAWGPLGSVEVRWRDTLTWLVYPSRLPWPGIRVRAVVSGESGRAPEARLFHLATSLLDHASSVLADDTR